MIAVGHTQHARVEFFDFEEEKWTYMYSNYPFASSISRAPVLYHSDAFYVIGGYDYNEGTDISTIGRFKDSKWTEVGSLQSGRRAHGAVLDENSFYVIGGMSDAGDLLPTKKCEIYEYGVNCVDQAPVLPDYANYPELFM